MAKIIRLAAVVADKVHTIILRNMLRVFLHKRLDAIPNRLDSLSILVQTEHEAILLALVAHQLEGIVGYIAVVLDAGLDAPVVVVLLHELVAEEKAGLEAAHVAVADGVAVDDFALLHVLADVGGFVLVDEARVGPVLFRDLSVVRGPRD